MHGMNNRFATLGLAALSAAALVVLSGGCVESNSRAVLGDDVPIEVFSAVGDAQGSPGRKIVHDKPSLKGLDRSDWPLKQLAVPVDGTRHRNTYRSAVNLTDQTRRQRGEYPTMLSVLNGNGSADSSEARDQRIAEAALAPAHALLEAFLLPFRLIGEPQSWENFSPGAEMSYERQPAQRSQLSPPEIRAIRSEKGAGAVR
jgi:hypothetical protein